MYCRFSNRKRVQKDLHEGYAYTCIHMYSYTIPKKERVSLGLLCHAKIVDPTMYTKCIVGNIEIIRPGDWKWLYSHDQRPIRKIVIAS